MLIYNICVLREKYIKDFEDVPKKRTRNIKKNRMENLRQQLQYHPS